MIISKVKGDNEKFDLEITEFEEGLRYHCESLMVENAEDVRHISAWTDGDGHRHFIIPKRLTGVVVLISETRRDDAFDINGGVVKPVDCRGNYKPWVLETIQRYFFEVE